MTPRPDLFAPMDRRAFLRVTAGGAGALALTPLLGAGCSSAPGPGLRALTAKEAAVLQGLAGLFVPGGNGAPTAQDVDVAGFLDVYFAGEPPALRKQIKQALVLIEYGGLWWGPKRARFTRMSADARARYLGEWLAADSAMRRQVGQLFRRACINAYYTDERAWDAIGYDGPFVS